MWGTQRLQQPLLGPHSGDRHLHDSLGDNRLDNGGIGCPLPRRPPADRWTGGELHTRLLLNSHYLSRAEVAIPPTGPANGCNERGGGSFSEGVEFRMQRGREGFWPRNDFCEEGRMEKSKQAQCERKDERYNWMMLDTDHTNPHVWFSIVVGTLRNIS